QVQSAGKDGQRFHRRRWRGAERKIPGRRRGPSADLLCAVGTKLYVAANDSRPNIGAARKHGIANRGAASGACARIAHFRRTNSATRFGGPQRLLVLPLGRATYGNDGTTWADFGCCGSL